jgi:hypothetical protein
LRELPCVGGHLRQFTGINDSSVVLDHASQA